MRQILELRRQLAVSRLHIELVQRFWYERLETVQLFCVARLLDVIIRAFAHRLDSRVNRALAGDDDAFGGNPLPLELFQQRETIELGHLQIGENDSEVVSAQLVERFLAI